MSAKQSFRALLAPGPKGGVVIPLPFDPHALWGRKPRHLIGGSIAGKRFRGEVEFVDGQPALVPKPAWLRDNPTKPGMEVDVEIAPEGPQRGALDPDIAEALAAEPEAAAFWDGLAQFYRKAYLTWITSTKKKPDERARRLAETIALLKAGKKERPK